MKHKVSELEGALLDAAVARAEGKLFDLMNDEWGERAAYLVLMVNLPEFPLPVVGDKVKYCPSSQWQVGGPIIERERINLQDRATCWQAHYNGGWSQMSESPLIAAMRAYVASKLGEEVELP